MCEHCGLRIFSGDSAVSCLIKLCIICLHITHTLLIYVCINIYIHDIWKPSVPPWQLYGRFLENIQWSAEKLPFLGIYMFLPGGIYSNIYCIVKYIVYGIYCTCEFMEASELSPHCTERFKHHEWPMKKHCRQKKNILHSSVVQHATDVVTTCGHGQWVSTAARRFGGARLPA